MVRKHVVDIDALMALNPEFVAAIWKGEQWALSHLNRCRSLNAGESEGYRRPFDGKSRKWCGGACPFPEGCVTCTLPENPEMARFNKKPKDPINFAREGVITIAGHLNSQMVAKVRDMLAIAEEYRANELEVKIESDGGDCVASLEIYDLIRNARVKRRVGVVERYARSGAVTILQACDYRIAAPHAYLLIHHIRFDTVTLPTLKNPESVKRMIASCERDDKRFYEIFVSRTGRSIAQIERVCDKDTDLTSTEALRLGLIDIIRE